MRSLDILSSESTCMELTRCGEGMAFRNLICTYILQSRSTSAVYLFLAKVWLGGPQRALSCSLTPSGLRSGAESTVFRSSL